MWRLKAWDSAMLRVSSHAADLHTCCAVHAGHLAGPAAGTVVRQHGFFDTASSGYKQGWRRTVWDGECREPRTAVQSMLPLTSSLYHFHWHLYFWDTLSLFPSASSKPKFYHPFYNPWLEKCRSCHSLISTENMRVKEKPRLSVFVWCCRTSWWPRCTHSLHVKVNLVKSCCRWGTSVLSLSLLNFLQFLNYGFI